jgi:hypothetical protein
MVPRMASGGPGGVDSPPVGSGQPRRLGRSPSRGATRKKSESGGDASGWLRLGRRVRVGCGPAAVEGMRAWRRRRRRPQKHEGPPPPGCPPPAAGPAAAERQPARARESVMLAGPGLSASQRPGLPGPRRLESGGTASVGLGRGEACRGSGAGDARARAARGAAGGPSLPSPFFPRPQALSHLPFAPTLAASARQAGAAPRHDGPTRSGARAPSGRRGRPGRPGSASSARSCVGRAVRRRGARAPLRVDARCPRDARASRAQSKDDSDAGHTVVRRRR